MSWRAELLLGKAYIEELYIGTYPGTLLSGTELGYLDGVTAGTVTESKALVVDENKDIATIRHLTISGNLVTGTTTLSEAELGVLDAVTLGTAAVSKAATFDANGKIDFAGMHGGTAAANALLLGGGTSGDPMTTATAGKVFMEFRTESTATSGDSRALYIRHALNGAGLSGEAIRAFTKVGALALGSAARGAHISLDFTAVGEVTGLGVGVDAQLMMADALTSGTLAVLNAEAYGSAAGSNVPAGTAFLRCNFGGDPTAIGNIEDNMDLISVQGGTLASGAMTGANTAGAGTLTFTNWLLLRINLHGTTHYIPCAQTIAAT
jgi:hypothetical protein